MSQPPNVCFYSNKCRWSEAFIKAIKGTSFVKEVQFICVDGRVGELTQKYKWLKKTPTLIVKGEDEPRTDGNVMNWLAEKQLMNRPNSGAAGVAAAMAEPEPWIGSEMGGSLTKGFSFIGGEEDAPKGNFEFLNGNNGVASKTASDMPGGGLGARAQNKSKKEELFDKQMETYMRDRQQGMPQMPMRQ